jgi:surface protein
MDIVSYLLGKNSSGGGGGSSEYFTETIATGSNTSSETLPGWAKTLKKLPHFTVSGTSGAYMFKEYHNETLDISYLDVSSLTDMYNMFERIKCTTINVSGWNVQNVTTMYYLFTNAINLTELDLSSWYTPNLTEITAMFSNCRSLTRLDIRNFIFDNVVSYRNAFSGVNANCLIIVKDDTQKTWLNTNFPELANVKTVSELNE